MRTDIRSLLKRRGTRLGFGLGAALLLQAAAGLAGPKDFAVYSTRLGGDAETAQPYVDKLAAHLEKTSGWPKDSSKGQFFVSKKDVLAGIEQQKPGFAFIEPQLYLELRKAAKMEAVAGVDSAELNTTKLNVVVKDPAYKSLADLKGKKVWTTLADWPRYLSHVVFGGKGPANLELKQIGAVTKGARAVIKGDADATLLDDQQLEEMKKLEGGAALRTIYSSPKLPTLLVVVIGLNPATEKQRLAKSLIGMCGTASGGPVCKEMRITQFVALDNATLNAAMEAYDKP